MATQNSGLPRLMWVDLTSSVKHPELPELFQELFTIVRPHDVSSVEAEIVRCEPDVLLFDYDYPDRPALKLLELTKKKFPSTPILMTTVQHSEAMAVWAFRARVWDYLVKPVSEVELRRCLSSMILMLQKAKERVRSRRIESKASPLPRENRVSPRVNTPAELMPGLAYIEKNLAEKVTSEQVAKVCNMDSFKFSRCFKAAFGITFREFLIRTRIAEACRLLEKPGIAIADVANLSGFNDPSHFSKVFRRLVGVKPSDFAEERDRDGLSFDILPYDRRKTPRAKTN